MVITKYEEFLQAQLKRKSINLQKKKEKKKTENRKKEKIELNQKK